ncbi:MAG: ATP-dependent DNA helicase [bacterium]|nr:ATP-dependent DNA helicase [bacterium]
MDNEEKRLNAQQKEAVRHGNGPLLIIAGAGTGKTTVVTERIKWLISQNLARPSEILALTFTDKSAREMEEMVDIAVPYGYTQMWISTFHAFCDRILRNEAVYIGLTPEYKLMTEAETIIFLRQNLFKFELDYFRPLGNPTKFLQGMLQHFSRLKDEDVEPEEYTLFAQSQSSKGKTQNKEEKEENAKITELARAYKTYEELKVKEGAVDFSDLIAQTLKLFRTRPKILKTYREQFKYLLVDEFQDTNFAQYSLIKVLAPPKDNPNLTVVGDDSQSIYKFRGAAVSNILQFMEDFKGAKQVVLTKNYRSTQTILDAAYKLIKNNDPDTLEAKLGISKNLKKMRNAGEEKIEFLRVDRVENEADLVARKIKELTKLPATSLPAGKAGHASYTYSDFAILIRANNHADPFVRALQRAGVPYQFLGPGRLLNQPEIKDLIAYLKLLYNLEDSVAAFRVLSMEIWEVKPRDLAALSSFAKKTNLSLFESAEFCVGVGNQKINNLRPAVSEVGKEGIKKFVEMVYRHLKLLVKDTAGQILYYFLEDSGLLQKLTDFKNVTDERRAQNISKFFDKLKSYEAGHEDATVAAVVDWIEMSLELGESPQASNMDWTEVNAVNILTVHSAKGLEFPVVFLVNLVSQRFPTTERREQIPIPQELIKEILPEGDYHLEEERRLFYVGMTRARDRLFLTAANYYGEGKRERKISPFVFEALGEEVGSPLRVAGSKQLSFLEWGKREDEIAPSATRHTPITYLSYSQIETFKACPFHYKLKFILRIPTPPSAAQSFGTSLHAVLRDFYKGLITGERLEEKDLLNLLEKNWIIEGYKSRTHGKLYRQKGTEILHSFWRKNKDLTTLPLALEQPFAFPLKNIRIVGRLDRVDPLSPSAGGGIEIIDYKTGAKTLRQKEVDQNLQLTLYALAATQVPEPPLGKRPKEVLLSLYYLEAGEKISTRRTVDQLDEAKKEVLEWVEKISTSDFRCSHSTFCRMCEYRLLCEES